MNDSERKVAFYIRVSTERQAKVEEGSLKNQEQILLAELEKRNLQNKDWGELIETDIDTTSPYKNLITKILMVFGEFEREMTSQRTSINAYERSKRGLANGGFVPLGYKRDKNKKGYLIVDNKEAEIVKEIFKTYIKEKSIKKTMIIIKSKYEGLNSNLKKITTSKIYSILTNKACIGIKEIYKRDKNKYEEVKAVWKKIIDEKIFKQAGNLLQINKDKYHSKKSNNFNYLLSGLIRCGKCGEKLQGKSAYSSINKKHYYYSHKNTCKDKGINRIEAKAIHKLVMDWLKDISINGDKFRQLQEQGKIRINKRINFLNKSIKELNSEKIKLEKEIEIRVAELVNTQSDIIKNSIEKSIVRLEEGKKDIEGKKIYIEYEIEELNKLIADDKNLFNEYSQRIKDVLKCDDIKGKLRDIIAFIRLEETDIKIALSGVNQKGLVSMVFVSAPLTGQISNYFNQSKKRTY